ncbi:hypothetical protein L2E82_19562 [Cichorium intybus]|uniref:Uncharacterized protein n=1 Tax=Cichorium intybus TaxID=13427 RepID=A0ACB9FDM0_CICIN|nr:hypothetical protein L2E82_19562 [Cichorium intybus]
MEIKQQQKRLNMGASTELEESYEDKKVNQGSLGVRWNALEKKNVLIMLHKDLEAKWIIAPLKHTGVAINNRTARNMFMSFKGSNHHKKVDMQHNFPYLVMDKAHFRVVDVFQDYAILERRPLRQRRLPCSGIGIGWLLFIIGFIFAAIPWYGGAFILIYARYDDREKPGYIACLIAAIIGTIAVIFGVTGDDWDRDGTVNHSVKFKEAAKDGNLIPLYRPTFYDHLIPVLAYRCLVKEDDRDAPIFLFESVESGFLKASNVVRIPSSFTFTKAILHYLLKRHPKYHAVDPCKWDGRCRRVLPKVEFAWLICRKMIDALKQGTQHRKINNEIGSVKGPTPKDGCFDESRKGNYIKKINNEIGSVKGPTPKDGCFDESRKGNYIKLKQCLQ